ncbi:DUF930 domain-containing protein [uncultured Devosia sp.]|uniref:DUF930 domain-containing protein n=1 Tax=uncultured Devosia sp. TaxID=211434 RepID=UPI002628732A|nr:DUF930 domain-containing protein [uncultured Devosia sp.]
MLGETGAVGGSRGDWAALAASSGLHVGLALMMVWLSAPKPLPAPDVGSVAVDLVSEDELAALTAKPASPVIDPAPVSAPETTPQAESVAPPHQAPPEPPETGGVIRAHTFYASAILRDPTHVEVYRNFPLLDHREQIIQLCNIEALEQLRVAGTADNPDALVGYAFEGISVSERVLEARGGAYRAAGQWYRIAYRCEVASDIGSVSAFEFEPGPLVPQRLWEAHFLNADDDWLN